MPGTIDYFAFDLIELDGEDPSPRFDVPRCHGIRLERVAVNPAVRINMIRIDPINNSEAAEFLHSFERCR